MYREIKVRVESVSPLLMHNPRLANPRDPTTKALKTITAKRKKTDEDHEQLSRLEWEGGLYLDCNEHPAIPGELIESTLLAAGKKRKLGPKFKVGLLCDGVWPLEYKGPKEPAKMWASGHYLDYRRVAVQRAAVMRSRAIFHEWACEFTLHYDPEQLNAGDIKDAIETAGRECGFMDMRPRYGRFSMASFEEVAA